jgi:hypothetical protein
MRDGKPALDEQQQPAASAIRHEDAGITVAATQATAPEAYHDITRLFAKRDSGSLDVEHSARAEKEAPAGQQNRFEAHERVSQPAQDLVQGGAESQDRLEAHERVSQPAQDLAQGRAESQARLEAHERISQPAQDAAQVPGESQARLEAHERVSQPAQDVAQRRGESQARASRPAESEPHERFSPAAQDEIQASAEARGIGHGEQSGRPDPDQHTRMATHTESPASPAPREADTPRSEASSLHDPERAAKQRVEVSVASDLVLIETRPEKLAQVLSQQPIEEPQPRRPRPARPRPAAVQDDEPLEQVETNR